MACVPATEADVVYALVEVRKLLEQSGDESNYQRLVFFCNWVVHPTLDRSESQNVLNELDRQLHGFDPNNPSTIDHSALAHRFMSFHQLCGELRAYLRKQGITAFWTTDVAGWRSFARLYSEVVKDCPLVLTRRSGISPYLMKLEISSCEPDKVITQANPGMDYIGWKWVFTLDNGRSFAVPFTSAINRT
jgi:hypothetical protein